MTEGAKVAVAGLTLVLLVMVLARKASAVTIGDISTNITPTNPPATADDPFKALANVTRQSILAVASATCGGYKSADGTLFLGYTLKKVSTVAGKENWACTYPGQPNLWTVTVDPPL